jgi:hypothetical protein
MLPHGALAALAFWTPLRFSGQSKLTEARRLSGLRSDATRLAFLCEQIALLLGKSLGERSPRRPLKPLLRGAIVRHPALSG